jgi:Holliday junction resolvasome RuvABC endonuclease subunit
VPSVKRRPIVRTGKRAALSARLKQIQKEIRRLRRERAAVKRDEFLELSRSLRQVEHNADALAVQFTRIAQMQADIDGIKRALFKAKLLE